MRDGAKAPAFEAAARISAGGWAAISPRKVSPGESDPPRNDPVGASFHSAAEDWEDVEEMGPAFQLAVPPCQYRPAAGPALMSWNGPAAWPAFSPSGGACDAREAVTGSGEDGAQEPPG